MHTTDKSSRNSRLLTSGLVLLSASALMMFGQQNASAQKASTTLVSTVTATTSAAAGETVQSPATSASTVVDEDDDNTVNLWGVTTKLQLAPTTTDDQQADIAVDEVAPVVTSSAASQTTTTESSSEGTTQKAANAANGAETTVTTTGTYAVDPTVAQSTNDDVLTTATPDVTLTGETSTQQLGKNAGNPTDLTVTSVANSTDPAIKPAINNGFYDILTNFTSLGAALLAFPILATRQMTQVVAWGRSVLEPGRYSDVSSTWKPLDAKYDTANTEAFYTEAKDWYNNQVVKENWTVPMADGQGQVAGEYLKNGDSKKTLIFGQG